MNLLRFNQLLFGHRSRLRGEFEAVENLLRQFDFIECLSVVEFERLQLSALHFREHLIGSDFITGTHR